MGTKEIKATFHKRDTRVESDIVTTAASLANGAGTLDKQNKDLRSNVSDAGQRLLGSAKTLIDEVVRQTRLHPRIAICTAFVVGVVAARTLRRQKDTL